MGSFRSRRCVHARWAGQIWETRFAAQALFGARRAPPRFQCAWSHCRLAGPRFRYTSPMSMRPARQMAVFCLVALTAAPVAAQERVRPQMLWYDAPATQWVEALPIGNGRLGAMVFGGIARERIQFNESTVWTGGPHDYARPGAYRYLPRIRELLYAGRQPEAEALAQVHFMSAPLRQRAYQAFGDLRVDLPSVDSSRVREYRRELDLDSAVVTTRYRVDGVTYVRQV